MPLPEGDYLFHPYTVIATATTIAILGRMRKRMGILHEAKRAHGGFLPGGALDRTIGREAAGRRLKECYFLGIVAYNQETGSHGSIFNEAEFERRFRIPQVVYNRVRSGVLELDSFFKGGVYCVGNVSSTADHKVVAALRHLSLALVADGLVEMLRISESLIQECRKRFTAAVVKRFEQEYLRRPTLHDASLILTCHSKLGFPGCFGSLDCSGWKLSCGSVAEQQKTIGKSGTPEYRIESWCYNRLWIWHLQFVFPGAMNDLNILHCSSLFGDVRAGRWPFFKPTFSIAGWVVDWFYWVVDGIYPFHRIFLKTIQSPTTKRERVIAQAQEAFRKNAGRVYAVLFSRWHILAVPSRLWHRADMTDIVKRCAILHNMITEERDGDGSKGTKNIVSVEPNAKVTPLGVLRTPSDPIEEAKMQRQTTDKVEDRMDHELVTNALADAIWERLGNGEMDDFIDGGCGV